MFKTAVSLEETGKTDIVALDKTGTITSGEPEVTDMVPAEGYSEEKLLLAALALEQKSEHPLAHAIVRLAQEKQITCDAVEEFEAVAGNGLTGTQKGVRLTGGNRKFIESRVKIPAEIAKAADSLAEQGKTPLFFAEGEKLIGMIAVADVIKKDSYQAIQELKNMGIHVVMLTGDNERTAKAIGSQAGVDEVIAGVLPDGKE